MKSILERFEEKFIPEPNTGCWIWFASRHPQGYGTFGIGDVVYYAHRVSWMLYRGEMPPPEIKVCHSCDNEWCVNPDHLWLGAQIDNVRDSVQKGRARRATGINVAGSKLNEADIELIRADNRSIADIANAFGCTRQNIQMILARKTWKHVP